MKKLFLMLLVALTLAGCKKEAAPAATTAEITATQPTQPEQQPQVKTTLMVYMIGSDLEAKGGAGTNDLKEIAESGVDTQTHNVVVMAGGTPKWHNDTMAESTCAMLQLNRDGFQKVQDLETKSMGETATLTEFLQYAYENYPADRYGLILWNHGNGPVMGYGADELYSKDALLLGEMASALQASPFGPDNKLAWVGFDACLMASAELACIWADYADYMISSQEIEPAFGWDYAFLEQLGQPDVPAMVKRLSEDYMASCLAYYERKGYTPRDTTLSCVDLSKTRQLQSAMEDLFGQAAANVQQQYNHLAVSRVKSRALGKATTGSEYDLIDLYQFAVQMESLYPTQAQALKQALEAMVVNNTTNAGELCGMSLYYPFYNKGHYEKSWREIYQQLGLFPAYQKYLEGFETIWTQSDKLEEFAASVMPEEQSQGVYILPLTREQMENYAAAKFYILRQESQGMYNRLLTSANVENVDGLLVAKFDGNVIYVCDDYGNRKIPVAEHLSTAEGKDHYSIYVGLYNNVPGTSVTVGEEEHTSEVYDYHLTYEHDTEKLTVSALVPHVNTAKNQMGGGKTEDVDMSQWTEVLFWDQTHRYLTRDENGTILPLNQWDSNTIFSGVSFGLTDGMEFVYEPLDGGTYYVMIEVMDTQGNAYCSELLPIEVPDVPKESYAMPNTDVTWNREEKQLLLDKKDVKIYIKSEIDDWTENRNYILEMENNNGFATYLYATDIVVNGNIAAGEYFGSILAAANAVSEEGQFSSRCENSLSNLLRAGEVSKIESLQLSIFVRNIATGEYLLEPQTITITFGNRAPNLVNVISLPQRITGPFFGAQAQNQVIFDNGKLRATLLGFGAEGDKKDACGMLLVENLADTAIHFEIDGGEINGIYLFSMADMEFHSLQPGQKVYIPVGISAYELNKYDMTEIGSLSLALRIVEGYAFMIGDSQWHWCPVELSVYGKPVHNVTEEKWVIYNENGIRVTIATEPDEDGDYRMTVYNGSDHTISVAPVNMYANGEKLPTSGARFGISYCQAGPNQYGVGELSIYEKDITEIGFCIQIRDLNQEGVIYTGTELITMPITQPEQE